MAGVSRGCSSSRCLSLLSPSCSIADLQLASRRYDIEPMSLTIRERTTSLVQFLVRLAGIVGGILVCSDFGFRTLSFALDRWAGEFRGGGKNVGLIASPRPETPGLGGGGFKLM